MDEQCAKGSHVPAQCSAMDARAFSTMVVLADISMDEQCAKGGRGGRASAAACWLSRCCCLAPLLSAAGDAARCRSCRNSHRSCRPLPELREPGPPPLCQDRRRQHARLSGSVSAGSGRARVRAGYGRARVRARYGCAPAMDARGCAPAMDARALACRRWARARACVPTMGARACMPTRAAARCRSCGSRARRPSVRTADGSTPVGQGLSVPAVDARGCAPGTDAAFSPGKDAARAPAMGARALACRRWARARACRPWPRACAPAMDAR